MTADSVSVVVVSRDRPESLLKCLSALSQNFLYPFEVVVVADPAGIDTVTRAGYAERAKLVPFDVANLALGRNLGIAHASGAIIAFIDDDAVAEPTWLEHLVRPFADHSISATSGFVRGRNGISFQWQARLVDNCGWTHDLSVPDDEVTVPKPPPGMAVKTEGTNMAVRRDVLAELGGFDPAFSFFHDETDLNLRLAGTGAVTAIVPLAQVHHGFEPSERRRMDRMPRDLVQIGQSTAGFLCRHSPANLIEPSLADFRHEQRKRLLTHLVAGRCEPRDIDPILTSLDKGFQQGLKTAATAHALPDVRPTSFVTFSNKPSGSEVIFGRSFNRSSLRRRALALRESGSVVTVMRFSLTALFHRVRFNKDGYWEHVGGIFGRSLRSERVIRASTLKARVEEEVLRLRKLRFLPHDRHLNG